MEKFPALATAVKTRWNLEHKKADITTANMEDLSIALDRIICPGGIDRELFKTNIDDLDKVRQTVNDWKVYQNYAYGIHPLKQYSEFSQSKHFIFHNELFEGRMTNERLSANYFSMFKSFSVIKNGGRGVDLRQRKRKDIVIKDGFTVP